MDYFDPAIHKCLLSVIWTNQPGMYSRM